MPAFTELYMDQGTTFGSSITLTDDITNVPINVTGFSVRCAMKRSHYSLNVSANITCTIANGSNGLITLSLPDTATANLKAGRYWFDVKVTDLDGTVSRPLEGIITVTPQVS